MAVLFDEARVGPLRIGEKYPGIRSVAQQRKRRASLCRSYLRLVLIEDEQKLFCAIILKSHLHYSRHHKILFVLNHRHAARKVRMHHHHER